MAGSVTERLDLLVADTLALRTGLMVLARRTGPDERKAMLAEAREVIDALMANPKANPRGHKTLQQADEVLSSIFA